MNKKILSLFTGLILFLMILTNSFSANFSNNNARCFHVQCIDKGCLKEIDGVKVLYVNGSNYEMGYQHGYFLKDEYMICHRAWLKYLESYDLDIDDLISYWRSMNESYPDNYKEEIRGRADALDLSFEEVAAMEAIGLALYDDRPACFGITAWGPATNDRNLYHIYSGDYFLDINDPVTNDYMMNHQLLVVRKPDNGYNSVYYGLPTEIGAEGGINENGVVISYTALLLGETDSEGLSCGVRQLMVMDNAGDGLEAIDIVSQNRTVGWNFIIGDGKNNIGYVVEQDSNYSYAGTWNNSVEDHYPSWTIDHMVRRANVMLDYENAPIKQDLYNRSNFFRMVLYTLGLIDEQSQYVSMNHHRTASQAFEKLHGNINLNNSMKTLRRFYNGLTSAKFFFIKYFLGSLKTSWHQHVICPQTGEMLISFTHDDISAHRGKIHYLNINELLEYHP